jgi:hypothetical protein
MPGAVCGEVEVESVPENYLGKVIGASTLQKIRLRSKAGYECHLVVGTRPVDARTEELSRSGYLRLPKRRPTAAQSTNDDLGPIMNALCRNDPLPQMMAA